MCPTRFVPEAYDPDKLRMLQQVFDSTWEQIALEHPGRDMAKDEELRATLAKVIVLGSEEGITDPVVLGTTASETLGLFLKAQ
jgi:hypothetical protein